MAEAALVISITFPIISLIVSIRLAIWLDQRRRRDAEMELQLVRAQIDSETKAREEERAAREHQQRALITVHQGEILRGPTHNVYEWTITNAGPAPALYVSVTLVEEETSQEAVPSQHVGDIMPTHSMVSRFEVPRAFTETPVPVVVLVAWTDDAGTHRERKGSPMSF